jgi:hypothetical protein
VSGPSARELVRSHEYEPCPCDEQADVIRCLLASRVEKVLARHVPFDVQASDGCMVQRCRGCHNSTGAPSLWPCPTVRLLNGEE